jgi:hypothetical protein
MRRGRAGCDGHSGREARAAEQGPDLRPLRPAVSNAAIANTPAALAGLIGCMPVSNRALARAVLARDDEKKGGGATVTGTKKTVTVKIRWSKTTPPQKYLEGAFDAHPVDWNAVVYVNGVKKGTGNGELDVEMTEGEKYSVKVVPTATGDDQYYETASRKALVAKDETVDVKLQYNRENIRFTQESWEKAGLDAAKVGDVETVQMLDRNVTVNKLVKPTVEKTNQYFKSKALTDDERDAVKKSIVKIGGYNKRTTSEGGFSNHSIGCAVDINEHMETHQSHHWKKESKVKSTKGDVRLLNIFATVVRRESGWDKWDPWAEMDAKDWLEANELFEKHFPAYFAALLDDALGGTENKAVADVGEAFAWFGGREVAGEHLVSKHDRKSLEAAAKKAKKAGKTATATQLSDLAADWGSIRAWIEGIVVYTNGEWAYKADHEKRVAEGKEKRTVKGVLEGMLPLHPKLVETMLAGGWSWLIDQQHAKDLMHFEDRAAMTKLKK